MTTEQRRSFRREGQAVRRGALIEAALALVAEGGAQAATVRAVAQRAGVSPGLIRHYFRSKDDLMHAACAALMAQRMTANLHVLDNAPPDPAARLAVFVAASLRSPAPDPDPLGLWAAFIHQTKTDPEIRLAHEGACLAFRDRLHVLIAALPRAADDATLRAQAIACMAVIDGLWLQASALPRSFDAGEVVQIGLTAVGAILGIDLSPHLPGSRPKATAGRPTGHRVVPQTAGG
jgi:TetR/AcrR family transcriptional repressor of bet genes